MEWRWIPMSTKVGPLGFGGVAKYGWSRWINLEEGTFKSNQYNCGTHWKHTQGNLQFCDAQPMWIHNFAIGLISIRHIGTSGWSKDLFFVAFQVTLIHCLWPGAADILCANGGLMKGPNTNNTKVNDEAIDQHQPIVFGKFDFHDLDGTVPARWWVSRLES